jgi:hypothetical protein
VSAGMVRPPVFQAAKHRQPEAHVANLTAPPARQTLSQLWRMLK